MCVSFSYSIGIALLYFNAPISLFPNIDQQRAPFRESKERNKIKTVFSLEKGEKEGEGLR